MAKKPTNNYLERLHRFMIYLLPVVLFFSYYPIISFGSSLSMNYELSLPLIWLVIFNALSLVLIIKKRKLKDILKNWPWLLFPIFLTISIFWSLNSLRGILTVGVLWLIYGAIYAFFALKHLLSEVGFKETFWKTFFVSTIIVCIWCFLQSSLDLAGIPRDYTLMCAGCTYKMFGFPHPNGFAIEPQFMGNLLLAPMIMSAWMYVKKQNNKKLELKPSRGDNFLLFYFFLSCSTLFLTFSRGAIYAFVVATIFLTTFLLVREKSTRKFIAKKLGIIWGLIAVSFLFTLNIQGIMSAISPTNDTYFSGISKVLNHLSLGIIDIRRENNQDANSENQPFAEKTQALTSVETGKETTNQENEAIFDGYVAESTDTRVRLTNDAISIWKKDPATLFFGVGLGGAGQALYINGLSPSPKEIVQNQYVSLLLETGLFGFLLFIFTVMFIVVSLAKIPKNAPPLLTLTLAFGITLLFFSGLPNALQIYLLPSLFIALFGKS